MKFSFYSPIVCADCKAVTSGRFIYHNGEHYVYRCLRCHARVFRDPRTVLSSDDLKHFPMDLLRLLTEIYPEDEEDFWQTIMEEIFEERMGWDVLKETAKVSACPGNDISPWDYSRLSDDWFNPSGGKHD